MLPEIVHRRKVVFAVAPTILIAPLEFVVLFEKVQSVAEVLASVDQDKRWVTLAFTWNGLRALGVNEASLATFPDEFKQGMVARAEMLGDTGENHPGNWVGSLASPDLHAIIILFARDAAERSRCQNEHDKLVEQCEGVEVLSTLGPVRA